MKRNERSEWSKPALRFLDNHGAPTTRYPYNPTGATDGLCAFTTPDGRALIMMPHPERAFRLQQLSYPGALTSGPWMKIFQNAYEFAC